MRRMGESVDEESYEQHSKRKSITARNEIQASNDKMMKTAPAGQKTITTSGQATLQKKVGSTLTTGRNQRPAQKRNMKKYPNHNMLDITHINIDSARHNDDN